MNIIDGTCYDSPGSFYRSTMRDPELDRDDIYEYANGRESWRFSYVSYLPTNEVQYISAEMEDGSWAMAAFIIQEVDGRRVITQVDTEPFTEPVKALNYAQVVSQSEIGGYIYVFVNAGKGASKIQFKNSGGNTLTYTRSSSAVNSITKSGDNEIWAISLKVYRPSDTYTVKAKYGKEWITGSGITFTVTAQ